MRDKKVLTFQGRELSVSWYERLCIHSAHCGRTKGDLFVANREPWCNPDGANERLQQGVKAAPLAELGLHPVTVIPGAGLLVARPAGRTPGRSAISIWPVDSSIEVNTNDRP